MFTDFQDELIKLLQSEVATGRHLEGFDLVQFSDAPTPHQFGNVVKVDWDNDFSPSVGGSGIQLDAQFSVGILTTSTMGEKEADRKLQDLLIRWQGGKWVGVLPCLVGVQGFISDVTGQGYDMSILPKMVRGTLNDSTRRIFRAGAYFSIQATLKAYPTDFL